MQTGLKKIKKNSKCTGVIVEQNNFINFFAFSPQEALIRKILAKPFKVPIPNYQGTMLETIRSFKCSDVKLSLMRNHQHHQVVINA